MTDFIVFALFIQMYTEENSLCIQNFSRQYKFWYDFPFWIIYVVKFQNNINKNSIWITPFFSTRNILKYEIVLILFFGHRSFNEYLKKIKSIDWNIIEKYISTFTNFLN